MDKKLIIVYCFLLCVSLSVTAQERTGTSGMPPADRGWYMGVQGGVPFGISTFSSFGADKTRAGISAGVYGGYRFNPVLSAEISMKWGKTALSAQDCCIEKGYWLGADGVRYTEVPADMRSWNYSELKSRTASQHYGLQLNVNILGFMESMKHSRWTLKVSPVLAAAGTQATIKALADDAEVMKNGTDWHLEAGGKLQGGYRITKNLTAGIYSGVTYLTGRRMDGMPEHLHRNNFLWESGVRLGWTFGKCGKKKHVPHHVEEPSVLPHPEEPAPSCHVEQNETAPLRQTQGGDILQEKQNNSIKQTDKAETIVSAMETEEEAQLVFPTVYFDFNRTDIAQSEQSKLQTTLELLNRHPDVRITVTGWCDKKGSRAVNNRYSLRRAQAVKTWLTKRGIAPARITVRGAGSDYQEPDAAKARRTDTATNRKETQQ